jgi:excinuclease ABC subunit A
VSIDYIKVTGAFEHNLKGIDLEIQRGAMTVVTGVSGSGKSSLAFDTILAESQRRFFYTLSHYSRQFLDLGSRPAVKQVSGLSPSISLAQNETMASRRSTVGSLTDVSELMGVSFARFGVRKCPQHLLPTDSMSIEDFCKKLLEQFVDQNLGICIPVAEKKKGNFSTRLTRLALQGFHRAYVDGKLISINTAPELSKSEKHTIKVLVDVVKVSEKNLPRLARSLAKAAEEGEGFAEYTVASSADEFRWKEMGVYSSRGGCAQCGFSWPSLDSRYFSSNSLGRCEHCNGYGATTEFSDEEFTYEVEYNDVEDLGSLDSEDLRCPECQGTGLRSDIASIDIGGVSPLQAQLMPIEDLRKQVQSWTQLERLSKNPAFDRVSQQMLANLGRMEQVGLGYLQLSRRVRSLSGGELQRLKLAGILGDHLRGVLYVLDEPSQGLHASEITRLCDTLDQLKKLGNTLLIVDHDETLMRRADWIVDLGPGGGALGGQLMAQFRPDQASSFRRQSQTAAHLAATKSIPAQTKNQSKPGDAIVISKPRLNNLSMDSIRIQKEQLNVISGVSGSGKSSLGLAVLYENARNYLDKKSNRSKYRFRFCESIAGLESFQSVHLIDRKPVAKSSVSMPATYLDVFGILRDLYGQLPESQIAGLDAGSFSLMRAGGRCEACGGRGQINLKMRFLADARVRCDACQGKRYRNHVLGIRYLGLNLSEILELTIDEALKHFSTFKKIQKLLAPAIDLGLGYLKMGQPSSSLSGGEAQRLKLVPFLVRQYSSSSLLILDEPTTGLHFEDVERLMHCLRRLVSQKATVILIEHNLDVITQADWLIDLGPGSASAGGKLMFAGSPSVYRGAKTPTAEYLG